VYGRKAFKTMREARAAEAAKREELQRPKNPTTEILCGDLMDQYSQHCSVGLGMNTTRYKARYFINLMDYLEEDLPISSLTTRTLELFLIHIAQARGNICSNKHLKEIKAMFNWALRREETGVTKNPCNYIKRLPKKEFVKYVPPIEHINLVLMAANPEQMNLIKAVFHEFGRIGEVLRLKWSDVDFQQNLINLPD
jgi:integrase